MKVNEIFYSLQGEGRFTGTPAVFVRLSGCNLKCDFCDTEHLLHDEMSEEDIVAAVAQYPCEHVVITGGEPTLQLTASLVCELQNLGKFVQIETNGTKEIGKDLYACIDWITCSPKYQPLKIERIDELKVVYEVGKDMTEAEEIAEYYDNIQDLYLQPCDTHDESKNAANIKATVEYIKQNPIWKLSLQTQKILNVR